MNGRVLQTRFCSAAKCSLPSRVLPRNFLLEVMREVQVYFGYNVLNSTIFPHSSLSLSSCRCRRSQYAEFIPCERFLLSKALNHSHFLHLVSVLHKGGGWGTEGRSLQNRQIPRVYPHLKEGQTKTIIATLSWTGSLDSSTKLSGECWHQENVLPWATSRCPRVMLCCSPAHLQLCSAVLFCALLPFSAARGICCLFSWDSQ